MALCRNSSVARPKIKPITTFWCCYYAVMDLSDGSHVLVANKIYNKETSVNENMPISPVLQTDNAFFTMRKFQR